MIVDDLVIRAQLVFLVHKVIAELKVNLVQKVNLVVQFLVHLVLMVTLVNLVFLELKVNVVYLVFVVYQAIQLLALVFQDLKDRLVPRVARVRLAFKVLLVPKEKRVTEVSMVFVALVMV